MTVTTLLENVIAKMIKIELTEQEAELLITNLEYVIAEGWLSNTTKVVFKNIINKIENNEKNN